MTVVAAGAHKKAGPGKTMGDDDRHSSFSSRNDETVASKAGSLYSQESVLGSEEEEDEICCKACGFESSFVPEGMIYRPYCKEAVYCSDNCRSWDWKTHQHNCKGVNEHNRSAAENSMGSGSNESASIAMDNLFEKDHGILAPPKGSVSSNHPPRPTTQPRAPPPQAPRDSSFGSLTTGSNHSYIPQSPGGSSVLSSPRIIGKLDNSEPELTDEPVDPVIAPPNIDAEPTYEDMEFEEEQYDDESYHVQNLKAITEEASTHDYPVPEASWRRRTESGHVTEDVPYKEFDDDPSDNPSLDMLRPRDSNPHLLQQQDDDMYGAGNDDVCSVQASVGTSHTQHASIMDMSLDTHEKSDVVEISTDDEADDDASSSERLLGALTEDELSSDLNPFEDLENTDDSEAGSKYQQKYYREGSTSTRRGSQGSSVNDKSRDSRNSDARSVVSRATTGTVRTMTRGLARASSLKSFRQIYNASYSDISDDHDFSETSSMLDRESGVDSSQVSCLREFRQAYNATRSQGSTSMGPDDLSDDPDDSEDLSPGASLFQLPGSSNAPSRSNQEEKPRRSSAKSNKSNQSEVPISVQGSNDADDLSQLSDSPQRKKFSLDSGRMMVMTGDISDEVSAISGPGYYSPRGSMLNMEAHDAFQTSGMASMASSISPPNLHGNVAATTVAGLGLEAARARNMAKKRSLDSALQEFTEAFGEEAAKSALLKMANSLEQSAAMNASQSENAAEAVGQAPMVVDAAPVTKPIPVTEFMASELGTVSDKHAHELNLNRKAAPVSPLSSPTTKLPRYLMYRNNLMVNEVQIEPSVSSTDDPQVTHDIFNHFPNQETGQTQVSQDTSFSKRYAIYRETLVKENESIGVTDGADLRSQKISTSFKSGKSISSFYSSYQKKLRFNLEPVVEVNSSGDEQQKSDEESTSRSKRSRDRATRDSDKLPAGSQEKKISVKKYVAKNPAIASSSYGAYRKALAKPENEKVVPTGTQEEKLGLAPKQSTFATQARSVSSKSADGRTVSKNYDKYRSQLSPTVDAEVRLPDEPIVEESTVPNFNGCQLASGLYGKYRNQLGSKNEFIEAGIETPMALPVEQFSEELPINTESSRYCKYRENLSAGPVDEQKSLGASIDAESYATTSVQATADMTSVASFATSSVNPSSTYSDYRKGLSQSSSSRLQASSTSVAPISPIPVVGKTEFVVDPQVTTVTVDEGITHHNYSKYRQSLSGSWSMSENTSPQSNAPSSRSDGDGKVTQNSASSGYSLYRESLSAATEGNDRKGVSRAPVAQNESKYSQYRTILSNNHEPAPASLMNDSGIPPTEAVSHLGQAQEISSFSSISMAEKNSNSQLSIQSMKAVPDDSKYAGYRGMLNPLARRESYSGETGQVPDVQLTDHSSCDDVDNGNDSSAMLSWSEVEVAQSKGDLDASVSEGVADYLMDVSALPDPVDSTDTKKYVESLDNMTAVGDAQASLPHMSESKDREQLPEPSPTEKMAFEDLYNDGSGLIDSELATEDPNISGVEGYLSANSASSDFMVVWNQVETDISVIGSESKAQGDHDSSADPMDGQGSTSSASDLVSSDPIDISFDVIAANAENEPFMKVWKKVESDRVKMGAKMMAATKMRSESQVVHPKPPPSVADSKSTVQSKFQKQSKVSFDSAVSFQSEDLESGVYGNTSDASSYGSDDSHKFLITMLRCCFFIVVLIILAACAALGLVFFRRRSSGAGLRGSVSPSVSPSVTVTPTLTTSPVAAPTQGPFLEDSPLAPTPNIFNTITPTLSGSNDEPTSTPTDQPSIASDGNIFNTPEEPPAPAPGQSVEERLTILLSSTSLPDSDVLSPQFQAFTWLLQDENLFETYSNGRILQRFALGTIYYAFGGDNWNSRDGWLTATDECSWFSLAVAPCNNEGALTKLDLRGNELSGIIPAEIGLLSRLEHIDLSRGEADASISGSLPSELGDLSALRTLLIQGHELSGAIPPEIGGLKSLRTLDLRQNQLSSSIPPELGGLESLQILDLSMNRLEGILPWSFSLLNSLDRLSVGQNNLVGDILFGKNNDQLRILNLESNNFNAISTDISLLSKLETLTVYENDLEGTLMTEIGEMRSLKRLVLHSNRFSGPIPTEVGALVNLSELNLSSNSLGGPIPTELGLLTELVTLELQSNQLNGSVPEEFSSFHKATTIRIDDNNITGAVPDSVCQTFDGFFPIFYADCSDKDGDPEVTCPPGSCCTLCCSDIHGCECAFPAHLEWMCFQ